MYKSNKNLVKPVIISMSDGKVIKGSITLKAPAQRISDYFRLGEDNFVTVFEIENDSQELMVINKQHIVWVCPLDTPLMNQK